MTEQFYTDEMRQRDRRLARAMGWTRTKRGTGVSPKGEVDYIPLFHSSHTARAQLLEWLSADGARWRASFRDTLLFVFGLPLILGVVGLLLVSREPTVEQRAGQAARTARRVGATIIVKKTSQQSGQTRPARRTER